MTVRSPIFSLFTLAGALCLWVAGVLPCAAQMGPGAASAPAKPGEEFVGKPMEERGIDVEEHVGSRLPDELRFTTSDGRTVALGEYFRNDTRPAIIVLGYYRCPVVCGVLREKLMDSLRGVDLQMGKDYRVLAFSFDPGETADAAASQRTFDLGNYTRGMETQRDGAGDGLTYHVADGKQGRRLADAIGFRYKQLGNGEYSHPVCLTLVTPDGTVSRYLYGFAQEPKDLRLALLEASQGKLVRSVGDRLMAYCYQFDPTRGQYTLQATRVMQIGGAFTLVTLATVIGGLLLGEKWKKRRERRGLGAAQTDAVAGGQERAGSLTDSQTGSQTGSQTDSHSGSHSGSQTARYARS